MASNLFSHGVRPIPQRLAIGKPLFEKTERHIDASGLYEELATSTTKVSLETVYNALRVFDQMGLVRRVALREAAIQSNEMQWACINVWFGEAVPQHQIDRRMLAWQAQEAAPWKKDKCVSLVALSVNCCGVRVS